METMHFYVAYTKFLLKKTSFHILRVQLNNLAWIQKALGVQDWSYLNPSPRLIVLCDFSLIFLKFSCIFMNIQMRNYSYGTTGWLDLSNYNIDYIKTCNNDNAGIKSAYLYL